MSVTDQIAVPVVSTLGVGPVDKDSLIGLTLNVYMCIDVFFIFKYRNEI